MTQYYINWSVHSNNWLVKKTEEGNEFGKIVQIFQTKEKAEKFLKELLEREKQNGLSTKREWFYSDSN